MSQVVLFDAVGTILRTTPDVIQVYHAAGRRHGSVLDEAEIKARFKVARRRLFDLDTSADLQPPGQLVSSDSIERELWLRLITDIFVDVARPRPLFDELWKFFADADNWQLFPDTAAVFKSLKSAGHLIGIASNFDSRLYGVVNEFRELICADFVFCSAEIGYRKPDPTFYATVETKIKQQLGRELHETIWMTGDCIENDFRGPRRHGWNAVWLNRSGQTTADTDHELNAIPSLDLLSGRIEKG